MPLMLQVMERAVEADLAEPALNLAEVADWVGSMILDGGQRDKPLKKHDLLKVRDLFRTIHVYEKAIEACRLALALDPDRHGRWWGKARIWRPSPPSRNPTRGDQGQGRKYLPHFRSRPGQAGRFGRTRPDRQDRKHHRSADRHPPGRDRSRTRYDPIKYAKLADALQEKETDESQSEAVAIYKELWEKTKQYLYKEQAGTTQIKMINRPGLRGLKKAAEEKPKDEQGGGGSLQATCLYAARV